MGTGSSTRARKKTRELLIRALYQRQIAGHSREELVEQAAEDTEFSGIDQEYFEELLSGVLAHAESLDELIDAQADRGVDQLDAVGRAVLWLGLEELRTRYDVPTKVIINEAVELAKRYGPADSFRFVNAVLDSVSRSMGDRPAPQAGEQ